MHENEEKPIIPSHDEAPANSSNLDVLSVVPKHNGHTQSAPSENQQIMLMQQPQLVAISGSQAVSDINHGLAVQSSASATSIQPSQPQTYTAAAAAGLTTSVGEYVIPSASLLQSGSGYVHVPVMGQQETAETEVDSVYDDIGRDKDELREQDRFLPIANVARIMKRAIPESGKIAKDAKECVQECVSEFISFITSEASERCQQEKRKTINGEDILFAMTTLGFDNYVEPLKLYLGKYRESIKGEKIINISEYNTVEVEDGTPSMQTIQYQVGNSLHPSMVSGDGTYAYTQAQVSQLQQSMHFNT